jgi:cellulose synthase/poly-beta-1,6-N-acetylglucosamine synthase-like glycosyltransferase
VKNAEATVEQAIAGILKQDFPRASIELIVVEGFSHDQTFAIVKDVLSEVNIDYKIYRDDKGLGAARQTVIDSARGVYIVWVDGDMILPHDYVREQVEFMENNHSVAVAGGKYGLHMGQGIVADLENLVYAVDSIYGEKGASKFGHLPGTEGAIYRVEAIRQAGGFDINIKGAAEDSELVYRLITKGWDVKVTNEFFVESTRNSLFSLWNQYFWYGYGGHFIFHKNADMLTLWKMTPPAGFMAGLLRFSGAYMLTHRKMVFLLPLHYTFKRIAWLFGFFRAHLEEYGHGKQIEHV